MNQIEIYPKPVVWAAPLDMLGTGRRTGALPIYVISGASTDRNDGQQYRNGMPTDWPVSGNSDSRNNVNPMVSDVACQTTAR